MKYCIKNFNYILILFILFSCGTSDDSPPLGNSVSIEITSFITSKNTVEISWNLERFNNAIVTDLNILRYSNDEDADNTNRQQIIANLPSNETSFIDEDVPYLENLNYIIIARYYIEKKDYIEYFDIQSEEASFERAILKISRVPDHIIQDPKDLNNYHFLTVSADINLSRYDMIDKNFKVSKTYENGYLFYDKIITYGQDIFLGMKSGLIYDLDSKEYFQKAAFSVPIIDELKSFCFKDYEIHYNDNDNWKYYNTQNGESSTLYDFSVINFVYATYLQNNRMLFINNNYPNYYGTIFDVTTYNSMNQLYTTNDINIDFGSTLDNRILHFKYDETEFISTMYGRVISTTDLSLKVELNKITGKNYTYFNYGHNGNLYGTVQNEKLIHVFDDKTYELIESIKTKLYPIFPLISENGELQILGSYSRIYNSNFAIEIF